MALLTIGHRASSALHQQGGTVLALPVPVGTEVDDYLLLWVSQQNTATLGIPDGWTAIAHAADDAQDVHLLGRHAVAADVGGTVVVTRSTAGKYIGGLSSYRNVSWAAPVRAAGTAVAPSAAAAWTAPSIAYTGTAAGLVRVDVAAQRSSSPATAWTTPAPYLQRATAFTTGSGATYGVLADSIGTPVGASPAAGVTHSNNGAGSAAAGVASVLLAARDDSETPPVPDPIPSTWQLDDGAPLRVALWDGATEVPLTTDIN